MDTLVDRIVTLKDTEPIDIYVNSTFLPACPLSSLTSTTHSGPEVVPYQ